MYQKYLVIVSHDKQWGCYHPIKFHTGQTNKHNTDDKLNLTLISEVCMWKGRKHYEEKLVTRPFSSMVKLGILLFGFTFKRCFQFSKAFFLKVNKTQDFVVWVKVH